MRLPPFCKVQYGGFIMCKLLDYGLDLLDDEEGLNYALDKVGFDDDKEYSYTWELVSQLFEYPWIDGSLTMNRYKAAEEIEREYGFDSVIQAFEDKGYTSDFYKQLYTEQVHIFLCECELEDKIDFYFNADFYPDDKFNFLSSLYAVGDEYKLDGLKNVCIQRAEKAGFKDFKKIVKRG